MGTGNQTKPPMCAENKLKQHLFGGVAFLIYYACDYESFHFWSLLLYY